MRVSGKKQEGTKAHLGLGPVTKREKVCCGYGQPMAEGGKEGAMHLPSNPIRPTYPYTCLLPAQSQGQLPPALSKSCAGKPGSSDTQLSQSVGLNESDS